MHPRRVQLTEGWGTGGQSNGNHRARGPRRRQRPDGAVDGYEVDAVDLDDGQEDSIEPATFRRTAARWCQRGMVSAEWAVGIIAAVALAGVLIAVVTHGQVRDALLKFVVQVIHSFTGYIINR